MSGVSERANGGANGPVLYASISCVFYPMCSGAAGKTERGAEERESREMKWVQEMGEGWRSLHCGSEQPDSGM